MCQLISPTLPQAVSTTTKQFSCLDLHRTGRGSSHSPTTALHSPTHSQGTPPCRPCGRAASPHVPLLLQTPPPGVAHCPPCSPRWKPGGLVPSSPSRPRCTHQLSTPLLPSLSADTMRSFPAWVQPGATFPSLEACYGRTSRSGRQKASRGMWSVSRLLRM